MSENTPTLRPLTPGERAQMLANDWTCAQCPNPATMRLLGPGAFRLCDQHAEQTRKNLAALGPPRFFVALASSHHAPAAGTPTDSATSIVARLADFRDDLGNSLRNSSMASVGNGARKKAGAPVCCRPGCFNPRATGESFCDACQDAGYTDGIGE